MTPGGIAAMWEACTRGGLGSGCLSHLSEEPLESRRPGGSGRILRRTVKELFVQFGYCLQREAGRVPEIEQLTGPGVDCADIVLNCLFCRFHDMIPILPDYCQRLTNHCWPNYKHVDRTVESSDSDDDDDSCVELDCGWFGTCHDASDCLELAMEVSEICYR
ncbi:hypothetical protein GOODEAATRI_008217 [Goodea atripinnis]|uniref:Uncharacterized protein n=1 Tax=Goodea atripinnis TaxID=208336 RepID=A0ABV0P2N5_9TELE